MEFEDVHELQVQLDGPLGDLAHDRQDLLRAVLGEDTYNGLSSYQDQIVVRCRDADRSLSTRAALSAFAMTSSLRREYRLFKHHSDGSLSYTDDISSEKMAALAAKLIEAGFRPTKRVR